MGRKKGKQYTPEFKANAVRLVKESGAAQRHTRAWGEAAVKPLFRGLRVFVAQIRAHV